MKFDIALSAEGGIVRIKVNDSITAELEQTFSEKAIAMAQHKGASRYFADVRGVGNVANAVEQYRLAHNEMARLGLDRTSRIAVLVSQDDHSHDFIETAFSNAGYSFRLFTDEQDALRWLRE